MKQSEKWEALWLTMKWPYHASSWLTVTVIALTIFGGLLVIVEPYLFKLLIDLIVSSEYPSEIKLGFSLLGILAVYGISKVLVNLVWDIQGLIRKVHLLRIERYGMQNLMRNICSLDLVYFEDPAYYNTLSQATSGLWRILEVFWEWTFFIGEFVSITIIVGALSAFDWRIIVLIAAGTIPSIFMSLRWGEVVWSAFSEWSPIFRQTQYYRSLLTERPEAIKEIRLFGLKEHFIEKFGNLFTAFTSGQDRAARKQLLWYCIVVCIEGFFSVIAAWLVVSAFISKQITIGELTFMWALLFQFAGHARWLVRMIGDINTHLAFIVPVVQVLHFKPTIQEPKHPKRFPTKIQQGIEFRNVIFSYSRSKKPALKGVNLTVKPNESIAIVGENGSGKTTLIKLLCRLYDVSGGDIMIDGINIKEFKLNDVYDNIGIIFQDFMKYEALIEENIRYGRLSVSGRQKVHEAAKKAGAWKFIKSLEETYKTHVGKTLKEEGIDLSVGQWQKVALARAFFRDAQILVLDEPTAAVDAKAEYQLFQKFRHLTKNKITFLISHRFSTVRMASKIIVMDKGKIIEVGTHEELLRQNGRYAKLFRLQAKGYA